MMNKEIDIILARYFSGEATEKELQALDVWLSKSDENEKLFHQMTLLYQHVGQADDFPAVDTERALEQFKSYMGRKEKGRREKGERGKSTFTISRIWKIAAAITILVVGTFAVFYFVNESPEMVRFAATETQKEFILFENTEVILFAGSEITHYAKANNQVRLNGKATFNVRSKTSTGIIVQAGETYIEDIGTIFTVDATAPDEFIAVEVAEGEVWFYTEINSGVYLTANERAVYDVRTKQFMMLVETDNYPSLRGAQTPEIIFQNTPLHEAINLIKAHYGVDIVINSDALNEILLNVSFDHNESVEYVLEIITATTSAQFYKKGDAYIITYQ